MGEVTLIRGPEIPFGRVISEYVRQAAESGDAAEGGDAAAVLLVPTARAAEQARERIIAAGRPGLCDPRIFTFPQLAEAILVANRHPFRRLSPLQRDLLLRDIIQRLAAEGRLGDLGDDLRQAVGLAGAVGAVIDDLKRAALEPRSFAALAAGTLPGHPANAAVAAIYEVYQARLRALRVYDEAGLFWEALALIRSHARSREHPGRSCRPLDEARALLVDGFTEFTTTQLHMLAALSSDLERTVITLCVDDARPELFSMARRTEEALRKQFRDRLTAQDCPPQRAAATGETCPPEGGSDLERLRRRLFGDWRGPGLAGDGTVRAFAVAGGVQAEVREMARRVKELLLQADPPTRPGEIAVIVRSFDSGHDRAIRDAFRTFGIPFEMSQGEAIFQRPPVQAVLGILDVTTNDWRREDVVKLLNNGYVDAGAVMPPGHEVPSGREVTAEELESVALEARVIGGRASWEQRLGRLSECLWREVRQRKALEEAGGEPEEATGRGETLEDAQGNRLRPLGAILAQIDRVRLCREAVASLQRLLAPLTAARSGQQAARALAAIIRTLRMPDRAKERVGGAGPEAADQAALELLFGALRELSEAQQLLSAADPAGPAEFAEGLRRACRELRLPAAPRSGRGVQVLDVFEARQMRYRHVFIPGLVEGCFPRAGRQDPFYHDEDRRRLARGGVDLKDRLARREDEALLFWSALECAQERTSLSFATSDAAGSPHLRSPLLEEVERLFAAPQGDGPGLQITRHDLSQGVGEAADALCREELAQACLRDLWQPGGEEAARARTLAAAQALRLSDEEAFRRALNAAAVERERDSLRPFGEYDGVMAGPEARTALRSDDSFGPAHRFSASQLGEYGQCPMRFFLSRVLRLTELDDPTEDVQARDLGSLVHSVLRDFFRARAREGEPPRAFDGADLEAAAEAIGELTASAFRDAPALLGHQRLQDLTQQRLQEDLRAVLEFEAGAHSPQAKAAAKLGVFWRGEEAYGSAGDFVLGAGDDRVTIQGRIDRVDILPGTNEFVVLDYKTGGAPSRKAIQEGTDFQLPLYCMAVEAMLSEGPGPKARMWAYYRVTRPAGLQSPAVSTQVAASEKVRGTMAEETIEVLVPVARDWIHKHARGIRGGRFPVAPAATACQFCDLKSACRHSEARSAKKAAVTHAQG